MKFAFTADQYEFRDAVRELLTKECSPAHVRDAWTNDTGRVPGLWDKLVEMGVVGLLAPEAAGGLGLTYVDLVLILEETGRHAVPEPIVETAAFGVPLLGDPDARRCDCARARAVGRHGRRRHHRRGSVRSRDHGAHPATVGRRRPAPLRGEWCEHTDRRRRARRVRPRPRSAPRPSSAASRTRMLELTVEYAKQREQFGVAIGSFQAVKHHLADARLALEFARPLVYRAAATLDPVHVSMAKSKADAAALLTGRVALQCHGAIGYTTEYDLHLYMKRAWALAGSSGDARFHRARVGRAIL